MKNLEKKQILKKQIKRFENTINYFYIRWEQGKMKKEDYISNFNRIEQKINKLENKLNKLENENEQIVVFRTHFDEYNCVEIAEYFESEKYLKYHEHDYTFDKLTSFTEKQINDKLGWEIYNIAKNYSENNENLIEDFKNAKIKNEDGKIISLKDLGAPIVVDKRGYEICTVKQLDSNSSYFKIDNTTYEWKPFKDMSDYEIETMVIDLPPHEYNNKMLEDIGVDPTVLKIFHEVGKLRELGFVYGLRHPLNFFIKNKIIAKFKNEELAECYIEKHNTMLVNLYTVEIDNIFYVVRI